MFQRFCESCDVSNGVWPAGGAQRTPVKQKMKTMSRSLQMLNVARLNVKALKSQVEAEPADRRGKRRSSDRNRPEVASAISECVNQNAVTANTHTLFHKAVLRLCPGFSSEAELLSHLKSSYDKTVWDGDAPPLAAAQQLLAAVKTFFKAEADVPVRLVT